MKVTCLRCHAAIEEYLFMRLNFLPYGVGHSHVMLECDKCGHIEFLSRTSPLLAGLQAIATYAGDGD
jgi:RNase P subunit RPR2